MFDKKRRNGGWITTVQDHINRWALFHRLSLFNPFPMLNKKRNKNYTFDWHEFKGSLQFDLRLLVVLSYHTKNIQ